MRKNKNFQYLLIAVLFSTLGDGVTLIAIPWLSTNLTDNAFMISVVSASLTIPWLLFSLHTGLLLDKVDRKLIIWISIYLRITTLFVLTVLIITNTITILLLIICGFLIGCSKVLFDSSAQTVTPDIVSEEDLEKANGMIVTARLTMSDVLGRACGGLLIAISIWTPFLLDTILLCLASLFIFKMKLPDTIKDDYKKVKLKEGFTFIFKDHSLLMLMVILGSLVILLFSSTLSTQVLLVREVLELSSFEFGVLISFSTLGSLLASNTISLFSSKFALKTQLVVSLFVMGLCFGAVGLFYNKFIVAGLYFIGSYFIIIWNIANLSYRQRITPKNLLGRVGGVIRFFSLGFTPLGMILGGSLVVWLEPFISRVWAIRSPNLLLGIIFVGLSLMMIVLFRFYSFNESRSTEYANDGN
ncbi:MFS transporter [Alkalibacillus salilacus]|uniref:MFS family permease n=1 Tax=Alkalibacillus salilacus TaxID=284582 RepID=A0ABT9VIG4_9BACI|nr:MFS transporter [Alkalibacillus salilacus]MDQ0160768.1 MFS family permease [Alkalibacillus salilacus]